MNDDQSRKAPPEGGMDSVTDSVPPTEPIPEGGPLQMILVRLLGEKAGSRIAAIGVMDVVLVALIVILTRALILIFVPEPEGPVPKPPIGLIVFWSDGRAGSTSSDLWLVDAAAPNDLRQLTSNPDDDSRPIWSPERDRIVFTRHRRSDNTMSLWVVSVDGTGERQVTPWWNRGTGSQLALFWHSDGERVYVNKDPGGGPCYLYWIYVDGGLDQPEKPVAGAENKCQAAISPDGGALLFMNYGSGADLELADLSSDGASVSGTRVLLPLLVGLLEMSEPAWSPNGDRIAIVMDTGGYRAGIYTLNADGSTPKPLLVADEMHLTHPRWSADGEWLAVSVFYPRADDVRSDIAVLSTTTSELINLTNDPVADGGADW